MFVLTLISAGSGVPGRGGEQVQGLDLVVPGIINNNHLSLF